MFFISALNCNLFNFLFTPVLCDSSMVIHFLHYTLVFHPQFVPHAVLNMQSQDQFEQRATALVS